MLNKYLDRFERKAGKYAVRGIMMYIVVTMILVYAANLITLSSDRFETSLISILNFDRSLILKGQVWRVFTFVFIPPTGNPLFTAIELYFIWLFGNSLEDRWGSFKLNVYYLLGYLGCVAAGCISGTAGNSYLNLSMMLAFAILYPNYEILLFFFIPVKMKWIGIAAGILLGAAFLSGSFVSKMLLIFSLINLVLFFGKDFFMSIYFFFRKHYYKHIKKLK